MNFNHVESVLIDYRLQYLLKISINWLIAVFTENAQELIVTSLYLLWYIDLFEASPLLTTFIISISKIKLWYFLLFIFLAILSLLPFKGIVTSYFLDVCPFVLSYSFSPRDWPLVFLHHFPFQTRDGSNKGKRRNKRRGGYEVDIILKGEGDESGRTIHGSRKYIEWERAVKREIQGKSLLNSNLAGWNLRFSEWTLVTGVMCLNEGNKPNWIKC